MANKPNTPSVPPPELPLDAVAEQGFVLVDRPDGVAVTLTPRAASRSARLLARAASDADRQADGEKPRRNA